MEFFLIRGNVRKLCFHSRRFTIPMPRRRQGILILLLSHTERDISCLDDNFLRLAFFMQSHILLVLVGSAQSKSFLIEGINLGETIDSPGQRQIRPESIPGGTKCHESESHNLRLGQNVQLMCCSTSVASKFVSPPTALEANSFLIRPHSSRHKRTEVDGFV